MLRHKKSTLTFTIPAYLYEEMTCRARSAKRCMTSELIIQLEGSLSVQPAVVRFSEVAKLKLFLESKDFSRRSSVTIPAHLHQKLKSASATTRQSMNLELSYRIQERYRGQSQNSLCMVDRLEAF